MAKPATGIEERVQKREEGVLFIGEVRNSGNDGVAEVGDEEIRD